MVRGYGQGDPFVDGRRAVFSIGDGQISGTYMGLELRGMMGFELEEMMDHYEDRSEIKVIEGTG
jgi:hypothetical protein